MTDRSTMNIGSRSATGMSNIDSGRNEDCDTVMVSQPQNSSLSSDDSSNNGDEDTKVNDGASVFGSQSYLALNFVAMVLLAVISTIDLWVWDSSAMGNTPKWLSSIKAIRFVFFVFLVDMVAKARYLCL